MKDIQGVLKAKRMCPRFRKSLFVGAPLILSRLPSDRNLDVPRVDGMACSQSGRCALFLVLALILDVVGIILLFMGIFAPLSFWDFFVLSGPLLIFVSLIFWIFWYLGSLTVPYEELVLPK